MREPFTRPSGKIVMRRCLTRQTHLVLSVLVLAALTGWGCGKKPAQSPTAPAANPASTTESRLSAEKIEQSLAAAQEYLNADDVSAATAILVTLIDRAPREVRARELYGQALSLAALQEERQGRADDAAAHRNQAYEQYRIAVEIDPASAGLQHSAGLMASSAGDDDAALEHFRQAGRLDPASAQYPLFEAQILIKHKRFGEAQAALERVTAIDPQEPFAHASLAIVKLEQGQFDEALNHIATARKISSADVGLRAQEARIHRAKGDPKRALELLIGLSPPERAAEVVAFEIAASYGELGNHIEAARAWQHCYQANPLASRAWLAAVRTAEALMKAEEREQASIWLEQAKLAAPGRAEVHALEDQLRSASP